MAYSAGRIVIVIIHVNDYFSCAKAVAEVAFFAEWEMVRVPAVCQQER